MALESLRLGLTPEEVRTVRAALGREPNEVEWSIIDAEWSEHSSYKSSKALLRLFPTKGKRVILGPGYDAGVVDVGDDYVVTLHIESHNHPSAVDPYGGASTGIGGVVRDILSMGTRPIALVDILRFGRIERSTRSRWLFRNVVRGIADYGNCISGEDMVYFTNSSTYHVAKAEAMFEAFADQKKLSTEFARKDLKISRPNVDLRVLSFDFEKKEARFCKVSRMYEAKVKQLLRIRTAMGRSITVTPDHPMFVVKDGVVETRKAIDLREGDAVPIAGDFPYVGDQRTKTSIDIIEELRSRDRIAGITVSRKGAGFREFRAQLDPLLRRIGVTAGNRSHYFTGNYLPLEIFLKIESSKGFPVSRYDLVLYPRRGRVTKIPAILKVDIDFARLVGYYLSEGCTSDERGTGKTGKTSRIIWAFRKDESEYIKDLCSILEKMDLRYSRRVTPTNAVHIKVSSQILGWVFREVLQAGTDSYTKQIPNLFYHLAPNLSLEILKGTLRGDGSLDTRIESSYFRVRFGSSSPVLFNQVLLLIQSLGYVPSTTSKLGVKNTVPFHELTINGRKNIISLKKFFSQELISRVDTKLALHPERPMTRFRSKSYEKFASVKIASIEPLTGQFSVYNFEVEGTHNYVTSGGIITHNCIGVPTVAGDVEFDESFERNCLVDVACVGLGRKGTLILGEAKNPGDILLLVGGSTGRDGIRGATFASKNLSKTADDERSSVQVPDPFMKKLLIDALLEAAGTGLIRGMKDLGGGGLSTALSEVASNGGTGVDVELDQVRCREADMPPSEVMVSESQERMLLMLDPASSEPITEILRKYDVPYSVIGRVTDDGNLTIRWNGKVVANLPAEFVVKAPLIPWPRREPARPRAYGRHVRVRTDLGRSIISLLATPNVASKRWVYQQYDHEVGIRTVLKPGQHDAALLRLPNGRLLAVKGDGNSAQCALDPYNGAAGCVAESCRNVVAVGGEPIALVDHLQFGDPSDPEVYWSFTRSVQGMADYCSDLKIPVVGGKVSFYNEDSSLRKAIKPSPIALVVGLVNDQKHILPMGFANEGDTIIVAGRTRAELGGSEYYRMLGHPEAGIPPMVNASSDAPLYSAILKLIRSGSLTSVHDCSRGGLAVTIAEMCISGGLGAKIDLKKIPSNCRRTDELVFSESHGRFVVATKDAKKVRRVLADSKVAHGVIGEVKGDALVLGSGSKTVSELDVVALQKSFEGSLPRLME